MVQEDENLDPRFLNLKPRTQVTHHYSGEKDDKDLRSGRGVNEWKTEDSLETYDGNFLLDNGHVKGVYKWKTERGNAVYEGNIYCNEMEGYGQYSYPDGSVYEGLFKSNQRFGPGVHTEPDGRQNVGFWRNKKIIKLITKMDLGVPNLARTTKGKRKLLRFRKKVTISRQAPDKAKEILMSMNAAPHILENSHLLYNEYLRDRRSVSFNTPLYDAEFYEDDDDDILSSASLLVPSKVFKKQDLKEIREASRQVAQKQKDRKDTMKERKETMREGSKLITDDTSRKSVESPVSKMSFDSKEGKTTKTSIDSATGVSMDQKSKGSKSDILSGEKKDSNEIQWSDNNSEEALKSVHDSELSMLESERANIPAGACINLVAWNNSNVIQEMQRFCFLNRRKEKNLTYDVGEVIKNNRRHFRGPGAHETLCMRFLQKCQTGDAFRVNDYMAFKGVDPNVTDVEGNTGLMIACANDQQRTIDVLLDRGADINATNNEGFTPLTLALTRYYVAENKVENWESEFLKNREEGLRGDAVFWRNPEAIAEETKEKKKKGGPDDAVKEEKKEKKPKHSSESDVDLELRAPISETTMAKMSTIRETIMHLLRRGANPTAGSLPMNPLELAVLSRDADLVKRLLESGMNPNSSMAEEDGDFPVLILAAMLPKDEDMVKIVQHLLEYGADPNVGVQITSDDVRAFRIGELPVETPRKVEKKSVLHVVTTREDAKDFNTFLCEVVNLLVLYDADVNSFFMGHTPLSAAIVKGNEGMVKCLLKTDAVDPNQKLADLGIPLTALMHLRYTEHLDEEPAVRMVDMLVTHGSNPLQTVKVGDYFEGNVIDFGHKQLETFKKSQKKSKERDRIIDKYNRILDHVSKRAHQLLTKKIKGILGEKMLSRVKKSPNIMVRTSELFEELGKPSRRDSETTRSTVQVAPDWVSPEELAGVLELLQEFKDKHLTKAQAEKILRMLMPEIDEVKVQELLENIGTGITDESEVGEISDAELIAEKYRGMFPCFRRKGATPKTKDATPKAKESISKTKESTPKTKDVPDRQKIEEKQEEQDEDDGDDDEDNSSTATSTTLPDIKLEDLEEPQKEPGKSRKDLWKDPYREAPTSKRQQKKTDVKKRPPSFAVKSDRMARAKMRKQSADARKKFGSREGQIPTSKIKPRKLSEKWRKDSGKKGQGQGKISLTKDKLKPPDSEEKRKASQMRGKKEIPDKDKNIISGGKGKATQLSEKEKPDTVTIQKSYSEDTGKVSALKGKKETPGKDKIREPDAKDKGKVTALKGKKETPGKDKIREPDSEDKGKVTALKGKKETPGKDKIREPDAKDKGKVTALKGKKETPGKYKRYETDSEGKGKKKGDLKLPKDKKQPYTDSKDRRKPSPMKHKMEKSPKGKTGVEAETGEDRRKPPHMKMETGRVKKEDARTDEDRKRPHTTAQKKRRKKRKADGGRDMEEEVAPKRARMERPVKRRKRKKDRSAQREDQDTGRRIMKTYKGKVPVNTKIYKGRKREKAKMKRRQKKPRETPIVEFVVDVSSFQKANNHQSEKTFQNDTDPSQKERPEQEVKDHILEYRHEKVNKYMYKQQEKEKAEHKRKTKHNEEREVLDAPQQSDHFHEAMHTARKEQKYKEMFDRSVIHTLPKVQEEISEEEAVGNEWDNLKKDRDPIPNEQRGKYYREYIVQYAFVYYDQPPSKRLEIPPLEGPGGEMTEQTAENGASSSKNTCGEGSAIQEKPDKKLKSENETLDEHTRETLRKERERNIPFHTKKDEDMDEATRRRRKQERPDGEQGHKDNEDIPSDVKEGARRKLKIGREETINHGKSHGDTAERKPIYERNYMDEATRGESKKEREERAQEQMSEVVIGDYAKIILESSDEEIRRKWKECRERRAPPRRLKRDTKNIPERGNTDLSKHTHGQLRKGREEIARREVGDKKHPGGKTTILDEHSRNERAKRQQEDKIRQGKKEVAYDEHTSRKWNKEMGEYDTKGKDKRGESPDENTKFNDLNEAIHKELVKERRPRETGIMDSESEERNSPSFYPVLQEVLCTFYKKFELPQ